MRTKLIAILVAGLFAEGSALAADEELVWEGSLNLGYRGVNVDGGQRNGGVGVSSTTVAPFTGPSDEAKANEYRDLRNNAVTGVIDIYGNSSRYWFRAFAEELGLDDQFINLRGGAWGVWRAQFYNDKIPHNLSWGALTPLNNPGSSLQVAGGAYPPAQNPALWNGFDYGIQRNTTGGNIEASFNTPWFFRADYNEVKMTGVRPGSGQLGTGSGNGLIEFGVPTDWTTKNTTIEAGYAGETWNVKIGFLGSKFDQGADNVQWTNFYMRNGLDTTYQAPSNDLERWTFNGNIRQLPLDSTLTARATWSKLTNSFDVVSSSLKPTSSAAPPTGVGYLVTQPSDSTFNGKHETTTVSLALNSTLMPGLESRLFYNYYDLDNGSTEISYAAGGLGTAASTCPASNSATRFCIAALPAGENFGYTKNEAGLDLTYRLAKRQKLMGGYNWMQIDRDLEPAPETTNQRLWIEYRNSMVANLGGRLKYEYIQRRSDLDHTVTNNGTATSSQVPYYFAAYDVSNFNGNVVKGQLDWTPVDLLYVGLGATWRDRDYKDIYYGRTKDETTTVDGTLSYGNPDSWRVTLLGNWGETKFDQAYHQGTGPTPGGPQTPTDFDWGTKNTQDFWMVGLTGDWKVNEALSVYGSFSYQKTGGGVDFWSGNTAGVGGFQGGPLVNYVTDNTKMQRYLIKADYRFNKNWSATAGYAYEKYDYDDDQMRGYQGYYPYFQNLGSPNISWYSGAFANPAYKANIVWISGTYRF